jgi:hypothetical protein
VLQSQHRKQQISSIFLFDLRFLFFGFTNEWKAQHECDEPNTDIITTATDTSTFRSSWAPDLGLRNV